MPWKEVNKVDEKMKFIARAFDPRENFTQLCRDFGIATKTGYKWKHRFLVSGKSALEDQKRIPESNPSAVPEPVVCELIRLKNQHPGWGPKKIHAIYQAAHKNEYVPARSTVERILKKAGLVKPKKHRTNQKGSRIQNRVKANHPNHVWTVDFKGWWYTPHKEKCEPLTVRDCYSRYILDIRIMPKGNIFSVKQTFEELFRKYGLPEVIRSDNGPPFASSQSRWGLTRLAVWWMYLGISLDRIDPGSPQQNGSHERMHRDMKRPDDIYNKSSIHFSDERFIQYPRGYTDRIVSSRGTADYLGQKYFFGNAFNGYNIGIFEKQNGISEVYFQRLRLGIIDRHNLLFTPERRLVRV